jgi:hypothetical protein
MNITYTTVVVAVLQYGCVSRNDMDVSIHVKCTPINEFSHVLFGHPIQP